ncbi:hypothetical protein [Sphingopyxis sp. PET50]|uniref:hypothetical protein n=1 Tax=Sphingopyxis sp. PET50 TaxID=2976533 RepID=UPI0021AF9BD4|nr:hypothetical protein [Sphingopyxis sp. PET50]
MAMTAERTAKLRKTLLSSLVGAIVGAGCVAGLFWLAGQDLLDAMGLSRIVLAAIGVIYLLMTAMIGFGLAAPRAGAKLLNVADAEELVEERANLGMSAAFTAALGLTLMLVALARAPGFAAGIVPGGVAMAAVLLLFAAATLTWRWQKRYDELSQQLGLEGA